MSGFTASSASRARERGQTETLGVILLLAITVIGAMSVVAFGATALQDARSSSGHESVGHAMTQFDSQAAIVALGDADTQSVRFGSADGGSYTVDRNAGWMNITHLNESEDGQVETFFNDTLGALVYEDGEVQIAYQGGGVWRKQGGGSTMVSPPEFHYRDATLTLPIIRVIGSGSAAGSPRASITNDMSARAVFPNASKDYETWEDREYRNPVTDGNVTVTVHSEYYRAWAEYFKGRTSGNVQVFDNNKTVEVTLISGGVTGDFTMPPDGNSINIRGIGDGHPFNDFEITVYPDDTDSAEFKNLQWTLYAEQGSQELEIHLRNSGTINDEAECSRQNVSATVYYSDQNGDPYHGWYEEDAFETECYDGDGSGDKDQTRLVADLMGDGELSITDLSKSQTNYFNPSGSTNESEIEFHQHGDHVDWEDDGKIFNTSGANPDPNTSIGNLTNHYLSLMGPSVELTVDDMNGGSVDESASTGSLDYDSSGGTIITYLHVTENRIRVEYH